MLTTMMLIMVAAYQIQLAKVGSKSTWLMRISSSSSKENF